MTQVLVPEFYIYNLQLDSILVKRYMNNATKGSSYILL